MTSPAERAVVNGVDVPLLSRHDWAAHLFSFRTEKPDGLVFVPGQFVRLGVEGPDGAWIWRAYSIASAPADPVLEFYSIVVPDGPFSQPLATRRVGDSIRVDPTVYGFLRVDRFDGGDRLWLMATGTGIAPFLSMLADDAARTRFESIVVVHSVRAEGDLAYRQTFETLEADRPGFRYLPIVTGAGQARITEQLASGALEAAVGALIDPGRSRLMICGNPSMIRDVRAILVARGLGPVRRDQPGQFIVENFW